MPVETCLSTLLSLVVGGVVEEEGWGGGRLYFESKHLISYNVKCLYDLIIALCTPRKKSFIIIYFNIYFFFLTQGINQVNMIANIVGFIFISTVLCHVQPITGPVIFTYFSLIWVKMHLGGRCKKKGLSSRALYLASASRSLQKPCKTKQWYHLYITLHHSNESTKRCTLFLCEIDYIYSLIFFFFLSFFFFGKW